MHLTGWTILLYFTYPAWASVAPPPNSDLALPDARAFRRTPVIQQHRFPPPRDLSGLVLILSLYLENLMTEDRSGSPDTLEEFVKKMARLLVPDDDVESMRERREQAAHETGCPVEQVADEDVIVNAGDEFYAARR